MGSRCRIVIGGGSADLVTRARDLVIELEQRWSRFLTDSEISALNGRPGRVTLVSPSTYRLISSGQTGNDATGGWYNPLMLDQLEGHGYRRSWCQRSAVPDQRPITPGSTEPVVAYPELSAVRLPEGTRFDPGGIGKGMAADMVAEYCLEQGATTVSVELGGDLRVAGVPWYGPQWRVAVANPFDRDQEIAAFTPTEGAVTTSTTNLKVWSHKTTSYHHLLDPTTGYPANSDLVSVTTCSSMAWWSEVAAKAALVAGVDRWPRFLDSLGVPGVGVTRSGQVLTTGTGSATRAALAATSTPSSAVTSTLSSTLGSASTLTSAPGPASDPGGHNLRPQVGGGVA